MKYAFDEFKQRLMLGTAPSLLRDEIRATLTPYNWKPFPTDHSVPEGIVRCPSTVLTGKKVDHLGLRADKLVWRGTNHKEVGGILLWFPDHSGLPFAFVNEGEVIIRDGSTVMVGTIPFVSQQDEVEADFWPYVWRI